MKLSDFGRVEGGAAQLEQLLARFNDTAKPYPRDETVHGLFARHATASPDAVALVHGEEEFTYRDLDQASNRFARFLLDHGLQREERVAFVLERPFEIVATMLGVLKAGGAYVPVDPGTPFDRIRHLLDSAGARVLVSEKRYLHRINRLQWECPRLDILFCVDSRDVHAEREETDEDAQEAFWEHVALTATDDISAAGWASVHTGEWFGRDVMDAYGRNVREKLLPHLSPASRVLEIGCSSGITLAQIAPLVGFYQGTDLSRTALGRTENEVAARSWRHVSLLHSPAHAIDRIEPGEFDVVIINGVVEFFSGHNYLRDVLRKAIGRMAARGKIFLGCVWDVDRKQQLLDSLLAFRAANVGKGYRTASDLSEELFLSRDFLQDLRHEFPEIRDVEFSSMPADPSSELSTYCYDAVLDIDRTGAVTAAPPARKKLQCDLSALENHSDGLPERSGPEGLAYVIYTSGTSGIPKGVMVEHRSIVRLVVNTDYVQLDASDRVLQTGSIAFDASTFEIWGPLLNGGGVCLPSERAILDPAEVTRLIAKHRITTMFITTSLFNHYVDNDINMFAGLRYLLTGGERASSQHFNKVSQRYPQLKFIHVYGPTENTTFTTHFPVERSYSGDVPIGRPIANTQVLILDSSGLPVPVGVPGEICAAGDGLARGYLNDPELTGRKFVAHPSQAGKRIYRTGDMGLWRADRTIEYRGRLDNQIKIRGYRIEPEEIEHHVQAYPDVRHAAVLARDVNGAKELVAYVTAKGGADIVQELRNHLNRSLPDYMVPARFISMKKMPLNANGKIDRKLLPEPVSDQEPETAEFQPPATETERAIVAIWEEVLGRSPIGVTDNFFDRGGHSLRIAKSVSLIERRLDVALPLSVFFTHPTVRALAAHVVNNATFGAAGIDHALVPLNLRGDRLLFAFPPGTGDALGFSQLAALVPSRFYGFNFIEADTRLKDYADLILQTDGEGPYVLFGYSSGGNLAYHVARELEQRGRRVAAIIMANSTRRLHATPMPDAEIDRVTSEFLGDESVRPYVASPILRDKAQRMVRNSLRYVANAVDYHSIDADIHVVTSENPIKEYRDASGKLLVSLSAWAEVTRGRLQVRQGFGHHNHMLGHPHLERNAELIAKILNQVTRTEAVRPMPQTSAPSFSLS